MPSSEGGGSTLLGGRLQRVQQDPTSGRVTLYFEGLSPNFVEQVFNGQLSVNLRDYLNALEQVYVLIGQYRARRGR